MRNTVIQHMQVGARVGRLAALPGRIRTRAGCRTQLLETLPLKASCQAPRTTAKDRAVIMVVVTRRKPRSKWEQLLCKQR